MRTLARLELLQLRDRPEPAQRYLESMTRANPPKVRQGLLKVPKATASASISIQISCGKTLWMSLGGVRAAGHRLSRKRRQFRAGAQADPWRAPGSAAWPIT